MYPEVSVYSMGSYPDENSNSEFRLYNHGKENAETARYSILGMGLSQILKLVTGMHTEVNKLSKHKTQTIIKGTRLSKNEYRSCKRVSDSMVNVLEVVDAKAKRIKQD